VHWPSLSDRTAGQATSAPQPCRDRINGKPHAAAARVPDRSPDLLRTAWSSCRAS
jgi:hypothetical protein